MPASSLSTAALSRMARALACLVATLMILAGVGVDRASAAALSPERLGLNFVPTKVNGVEGPGHLPLASGSGVGLARAQIISGQNADPTVALAAADHLRLYPMLGLPTSLAPADAASAMAQFVGNFAARYGDGGSFWAQHPELPYLPVQSFEIGNEPNMPLQWVADSIHLHWTDPAAYAAVYTAARIALKQVDPSGAAVVGGLADSASGGVDVQSDERWLAALPAGSVDAVGYHPYVFDVDDGLLETDTAMLRQWMDGNGYSGVPIDVNEFGACDVTPTTINNDQCQVAQSSAQWGQAVAPYTQWALCTPAAGVGNVQPFWWGDSDLATSDIWMSMTDAQGQPTAFGDAYLDEAHQLTTAGCPPVAPVAALPPTMSGTPAVGAALTASPGFWSGTPTPSLDYQWQDCNASGQSCRSIPGATAGRYVIRSSDSGSSIRLVVTATNAAGSATATSSAAAAVPSVASTSAKSSTAKSSKGTVKNGSTSAKSATIASVVRGRRMRISIVRIVRHGRSVSVTVRLVPGSGKVVLTCSPAAGHSGARRATGRSRRAGTATLRVKLTPGRWALVISGQPTRGNTTPRQQRRVMTIS